MVSDVYPLEGNEAVIGLEYFSEGEGNKEAILARDTGQLILGGPFNLVQGGQALVGRYPVYVQGENQAEKEFWGLVSVTLEYPQALDGAELTDLESQGFGYELWRISPDTNERQTIASNSYHFDRDVRYVERELKILNTVWYFRLAPIREWYQYVESWIAIFLGLFISFLLSFLVQHNHDLNEMRRELADQFFCNVDKALKNHAFVSRHSRIQVSYSAGIAAFPADGTTVDSLIASADEAMYSVKRES